MSAGPEPSLPTPSLDAADAPTPKVVRIMAFLMVAQVLCGFWLVGIGAVVGVPSGLLETPLVRVAIAMLAWQMCCALILVRPLLRRSATAWASVESILICSLVGDAAGLAVAETHPVLSRVLHQSAQGPFSTLVRFGIELALAIGLYRARAWFGVGEREGWRAMWRGGWWALVVTGGLTLAGLTTTILTLGR